MRTKSPPNKKPNKKQKLAAAAELLALFAGAKWALQDGGLYARVGSTQVGLDHDTVTGTRGFIKRSGDVRFKAVLTFK